MPIALRLSLIALFFATALAACGRTIQEDAPDSVTDAVEEEGFEANSDETSDLEGEFTYLTDLLQTFRACTTQSCLDDAVTQARVDGYSDQDIASGLGLMYLVSPGRRVLTSVVFVRFKHESALTPEELDAAYEYASTPPRLREEQTQEANAAEAPTIEPVTTEESGDETASDDATGDDEQTSDEEDKPRRRRGWFSWIPGL